MTGDAELLTGDPRWHNFLPGTFPLGLFFTGVEASGALSRDVIIYLSWIKDRSQVFNRKTKNFYRNEK